MTPEEQADFGAYLETHKVPIAEALSADDFQMRAFCRVAWTNLYHTISVSEEAAMTLGIRVGYLYREWKGGAR